jgi:hypothetical protein
MGAGKLWRCRNTAPFLQPATISLSQQLAQFNLLSAVGTSVLLDQAPYVHVGCETNSICCWWSPSAVHDASACFDDTITSCAGLQQSYSWHASRRATGIGSIPCKPPFLISSKWWGISLVWARLQGLHLLRGSIAQEKLMGEANARVRVLEAEIESLQQAQQTVITPPTITQTVDIVKSAPSKSGWVPWR